MTVTFTFIKPLQIFFKQSMVGTLKYFHVIFITCLDFSEI